MAIPGAWPGREQHTAILNLISEIPRTCNSTLFGKRLLLLRPAGQVQSTAQLIRQRGAEPVSIPLIAIEDPTDRAAVRSAVRAISTYDWVLLTSANGAERLLSALEAEGLDAQAFCGIKIGVIGPNTGEPLQRFGFRPDLVAEEHVAEGLLRDLLTCGHMRRVLVFCAAGARPLLPEQLRAAGVEVDVVAAYCTRRLGAEQSAPLVHALSGRKVDAVLVTSSSIATALLDGLGSDGQALLRNVVVASIGPMTSATLEQLGVQVDVASTVYTVPALLDALEAHFVALVGNGVR